MPSSNPKVAYLTAGAAGMFCGSCMRDNTLAAALVRLDCDVHLIPTYTPIRTDEESVAIDQVFFGGINVFLQQKSALFRWLPRWLDRLLDQPWLINWAATRGMRTDAKLLGDLTLSMLQGEEGHQRKEVGRLVDWLREYVKPDIVNLSNVLIGGSIPTIKREIGCKIVVTLQGDDLFLLDLPEPYKSRAITEIRRIARDVDGWIVFSRYYADFMGDLLDLDPSKVHDVPLGLKTDDFSPAPAHPANRPPTLGYLARICPAKGFHLLVDAFLELRSMPRTESCQLHAAGWLGNGDRDYYHEQLARIDKAGLRGAFHYAGVVDRSRKMQFLHQIDVLSVPTTYRDPKGIFALEAMASGVPVVLPSHGAFPELLALAPGGKLVPPNDARSLVETLHGLLTNPGECRRLGQIGRESVLREFNSETMARRTLDVYGDVMNGRPARSVVEFTSNGDVAAKNTGVTA